MSELLPKQIPENSVSIYNQTLEQFKSMFYIIKGKRDTQIKLYTDNKSLSRNAIIELNDKIQEKLLLHTIENKIINISVTLEGNHILTFGNWQEFLIQKWDSSQRTLSVTMDWEFEMVLPNRIHSIPQTHSLKVRFGQGLKPNEFFHLLMIGGDESELEESQAQMVVKVDFVNATIATELLQKVSDWYNALPLRKDENKINDWFKSKVVILKIIMEIFIIAGGITLCYPIVLFFIENSKQSKQSELIFCILAGIMFSFTIFTRLSSYFSNRISRTIEKLQGTPLIELTRGDHNQIEKVIKKNKSLRNEICLKLFISIVSSGILFGIGHSLKWIFENISGN